MMINNETLTQLARMKADAEATVANWPEMAAATRSLREIGAPMQRTIDQLNATYRCVAAIGEGFAAMKEHYGWR